MTIQLTYVLSNVEGSQCSTCTISFWHKIEQINFDRFDDDQVDADPNVDADVDADAYDDDSFQIT